MSDYRIVIKDLPHGIKGFITKDPDDFKTIVINGRYNNQEEIALHELWHYELNHLDTDDPVSVKEAQVEYRTRNKMIPSAATDGIRKDD